MKQGFIKWNNKGNKKYARENIWTGLGLSVYSVVLRVEQLLDRANADVDPGGGPDGRIAYLRTIRCLWNVGGGVLSTGYLGKLLTSTILMDVLD